MRLSSFGMSNALPERMSLAELAAYQNSRYVLAGTPRRGHPFLPDTAGFREPWQLDTCLPIRRQHVTVFEGSLRWDSTAGRYVVGSNGLDYRLVSSGTVLRFTDHTLDIHGDDGRPHGYSLGSYFAIETAVLQRVVRNHTVPLMGRRPRDPREYLREGAG